MITCPWCGTNYIAFQSNCKNCGGPLNLPPATQGGRMPVEEPLAPPPAPRPVSQSYVWKLFLADAWGISSLVLVLIGFIFFALGSSLTIFLITAFVGIPFAIIGMAMFIGGGALLVWRYQALGKRVLVLQTGAEVRGQVVSVEQNYNVRVNGRNPWKIAYRFSSPRGECAGEVSTLNPPGPNLQPGREVYVLYLPETPEINAIYPHP